MSAIPDPAKEVFNHSAFVELQRKYLAERAKRIEYGNLLIALSSKTNQALDILDNQMRRLYIFSGSLDKEDQEFIQGIVKSLSPKI